MLCSQLLFAEEEPKPAALAIYKGMWELIWEFYGNLQEEAYSKKELIPFSLRV